MTTDKSRPTPKIVRLLLGYAPRSYGWTVGAVAALTAAMVAIVVSTGTLRWVAFGAFAVAVGGLFSEHPIRSVFAGVAALVVIALSVAA